MTAPGGGGADEIREQLAAGLRETYLLPDEDAVDPLADALLPTVQALIAKGAAAELRAAAHRLDDGGDEAIEIALGGAPYVHRVLCDRAAALDGTP